MSIDLHCHTNISDNSLSIREVIRLAKEAGVTHLAVTDHDTTKGLPEAISIGQELGVEIIPGIEISAYDFKRKKRAHILGYYIEHEHPAIEELCLPLIERRHHASYEMVKKIQAAGYEIAWEQVEGYTKDGTGVYKQHIMQVLLDQGYCDEIYGELYKTLFSRGEKGGNQGVAYIPIEYIDVNAALRAIRDAGGIPVLAHPGLFDNFAAIPEWVESGLEGIEVKHPSNDQETEERIKKLAEEHQLVLTGGSDFHGSYGDHPYSLGSKDPGIESIYALQERKKALDRK